MMPDIDAEIEGLRVVVTIEGIGLGHAKRLLDCHFSSVDWSPAKSGKTEAATGDGKIRLRVEAMA